MVPEGNDNKASAGYLYPIGSFCIWPHLGYSLLMRDDEEATVHTLTHCPPVQPHTDATLLEFP